MRKIQSLIFLFVLICQQVSFCGYSLQIVKQDKWAKACITSEIQLISKMIGQDEKLIRSKLSEKVRSVNRGLNSFEESLKHTFEELGASLPERRIVHGYNMSMSGYDAHQIILSQDLSDEDMSKLLYSMYAHWRGYLQDHLEVISTQASVIELVSSCSLNPIHELYNILRHFESFTTFDINSFGDSGYTKRDHLAKFISFFYDAQYELKNYEELMQA